MTAVPWPILTLIGLLGLAIGSFLNVVIYRVPRGESIAFPSSHCPHCSTPIKARHNVPVLGWLVLRGRCATCAAPISARYPLIEAGTAALMVGLTAQLGLTVELPAFLFLAAMVMTLAMIDADLRQLPGQLVLPAYVVGALLLVPAGAATDSWAPAARGGLGLLAMVAIYLALHAVDDRHFTHADATLAGLLGLYLGWQSWGALLVGMVGGLLVGGIAITAQTRLGARHRTSAATSGPSIAVGGCAALFITVPLLAWYGTLLGVA